jgi:hypothetical protein
MINRWLVFHLKIAKAKERIDMKKLSNELQKNSPFSSTEAVFILPLFPKL